MFVRMVLACAAIGVTCVTPCAASGEPIGPPPIERFLLAAHQDDKQAREALRSLEQTWDDDWAVLLIELAGLARRNSGFVGGVDQSDVTRMEVSSMAGGAPALRGRPGTDVRGRLVKFLGKQTHQKHGDDIDAWLRWQWDRPYRPHPDYVRFKRMMYGKIDPRLGEFFPEGLTALIRLDEVQWGGTRVDGIPLLDHPSTLPAGEARYLRDKHVVFGVEVNGRARAYPQRILAWHEVARDSLGGEELVIVYCTLCGTVVPYRNDVSGRPLSFGTSGLLYRSNKLMYDEETRSLWSALHGIPLIGKLADFDVQLERLPVVTTSWGEWRAAHPDTDVLSLETGHDRNYAEGVAYREYFRTDRLWFDVPLRDARLKNKDEVLVMLLRAGGQGLEQPLAIAVEFLSENPVYRFGLAGRTYVVLTSPGGANRVYETGPVRIASWDGAGEALDSAGGRWEVREDGLHAADGVGALPRVPAQRAFWFGWYAQFPETALIQ